MIKRTAIIVSFFALAGFTTPAYGNSNSDDAEMQQALKALDAALPGKLINNPYDVNWTSYGSDKKAAIVKSEGAPGGMAYKITVKKAKKNPWDTAIRIPMTESIAKDDVILVSYWARAKKLQKGKETGDITVNLQRNIEPYDSILDERVALSTEWKLYSAAGTAQRDYTADRTSFNFNLAYTKQTLEFGQFYIMNLGPGADASRYMK